jgi:hypothetical protein
MPAKKTVAPKAARTGTAAVAGHDLAALSSVSGMAAELTKSADALTNAANDPEAARVAVDANALLWAAIKENVGKADGCSAEIKDNLVHLADHVAQTTAALPPELNEEALLALVGINCESAKNLMDGVIEHLIRERAYYLWLETGHCSDYDNWIRAEREIRGLLEKN